MLQLSLETEARSLLNGPEVHRIMLGLVFYVLSLLHQGALFFILVVSPDEVTRSREHVRSQMPNKRNLELILENTFCILRKFRDGLKSQMERMSMKKSGFQFLVDQNGDKTAVLIDLKKHRDLWEDLYDLMIVASRRKEPRVDWTQIKKRLPKKSKRHA